MIKAYNKNFLKVKNVQYRCKRSHNTVQLLNTITKGSGIGHSSHQTGNSPCSLNSKSVCFLILSNLDENPSQCRMLLCTTAKSSSNNNKTERAPTLWHYSAVCPYRVGFLKRQINESSEWNNNLKKYQYIYLIGRCYCDIVQRNTEGSITLNKQHW